MKVNGSSGAGGAAGPAKSRASVNGGTFSLPSSGAAAGASPVTAAGSVAGIMNLDSLLALQSAGGPLERKQRAMRRAGKLLDVLDEMKLGLLSDAPGEGNLDRLQAAIRDQRESTDDPGLEAVLNEIETRAAVELAKLEMSRRNR